MKELPKSIAELSEPSEYLKEVLATPPAGCFAGARLLC